MASSRSPRANALEPKPNLKTMNWFAIQTRPRAEQAALADIRMMDGREAYPPQETRMA